MTNLTPLEETLFQTWARAQGIDNHDDPSNFFDHRGFYKKVNGQIMPSGAVKQMAEGHNKSMEPDEAGGDVVNPDPYMAQAEMHKANLDSQSKSRSDQIKVDLEEKKMAHKTQLEQMKLQHKSAEADKDRQHKAQEQEQARAQAAQDAQMNRQYAMEDAQMQRQQSIQDTQMNRQHSVEDQVMQEQMTRSRPQPEPKAQGQPPQAGQPGQPQPGGSQAQPQPQTTAPQGVGPQRSPLESQLMNRAMRDPNQGQI